MRKAFGSEAWRGRLAAAGVAVAILGAQAAEPPSPAMPDAPMLIGARNLGKIGGKIESGAMADALRTFGLNAHALPGAPPPDWRTPPAPMEPHPWISVVIAGFGGTAGPEDQAEAYAFLFDTPGGPLKRLGHVSYRQTYNSNAASWNWIPPTHRLAAAVRTALARPPDHSRPLLGLQVQAGSEDPDAILLDAGLAAPDDDFLHTSMYATGRPLLEAMAWAAAFEAGWAPAPGTGPADASAVLEIYFGHKSCSLRLTLKTPSGERVSVKRNVPENRYHAHLRRMFMALHQNAFFSDFLSLQDLPPAHLFTTGPGTLPGQYGDLLLAFSRDSEELTAVDANTGGQRWRQPMGDVLVRAPAPTKAGLLVATKSNRVLLLDPETGSLRAERRMPAWISDILPVDRPNSGTDGVIACLTRNGSLYVLHTADLAIRSVHELGARAGGPILLAQDFPATWPGPLRRADRTAPIEQDTGTPHPCLLVSDEEGFAYIVPLSRLLK